MRFSISSFGALFCVGLSHAFVVRTDALSRLEKAKTSCQDEHYIFRRQVFLLSSLRMSQDNDGNAADATPNVIRSNITLQNYKESDNVTLEFELHTSIAAIPPESWNACLPGGGGGRSAFLDHAWLRCLEESKCASPQTGWVPQHVSIKMNGQKFAGFIPLYVKGHSSKCACTKPSYKSYPSSRSQLVTLSRCCCSGRIYL